MTDPYRRFFERPLYGVFAPVVWPGTWKRVFYLLLGFPIGLAWFVYYVTGLSMGVGLLILSIGALILAAMFYAAMPLGLAERWLADLLLDADVGETGFRAPAEDEGFWAWAKSAAKNPVIWKTHLWLLLRFPLGLASWLAVVIGLATSVAFVFAPLVVAVGGQVQLGTWYDPATPAAALPATGLGLLGFVVVVHLLNGIAAGWAMLARLLLGRREPAGPVDADAAEPAPALLPAF